MAGLKITILVNAQMLLKNRFGHTMIFRQKLVKKGSKIDKIAHANGISV